MIKKSYLSLSMRLDLFVKLKYESSTIILFVGIRYSMRDLLSALMFKQLCYDDNDDDDTHK